MIFAMTTWAERSPALAAMLNPALVSVIAAAAAEEYERLSESALPYAYPYLVAPLVLHRGTRGALPRRFDSHLATWLIRNPVLAAGFPERARSLAPSVTEGIRFGLANGTLAITEDGNLSGSIADNARPARVGDIAAIVKASGFVGRWFTKLDRPATAFVLFGV